MSSAQNFQSSSYQTPSSQTKQNFEAIPHAHTNVIELNRVYEYKQYMHKHIFGVADVKIFTTKDHNYFMDIKAGLTFPAFHKFFIPAEVNAGLKLAANFTSKVQNTRVQDISTEGPFLSINVNKKQIEYKQACYKVVRNNKPKEYKALLARHGSRYIIMANQEGHVDINCFKSFLHKEFSS
jgi:hypothetical protein